MLLADHLFPSHQAGSGPALLFLHGALADHRIWRAHQDALPGFFTFAYTQRWFGAGDWNAAWPPFGVETHARDLIAIVSALGRGPVHLAAWSYAGHVALHAVLQRPELFASLFIHEPGFPTWVEDPAALEAFGLDAGSAYGPVFEAAGRGALEEAARHLIDASGQPGCFDALPPARRRIYLDNARTLPLLAQQTPPPHIGSADLARLRLPVCISQGARTRPMFALVSSAAARAIPGARLLVVEDEGHLWPEDRPRDFALAVAAFAGQSMAAGGQLR